jgi:hypothetical protein
MPSTRPSCIIIPSVVVVTAYFTDGRSMMRLVIVYSRKLIHVRYNISLLSINSFNALTVCTNSTQASFVISLQINYTNQLPPSLDLKDRSYPVF